MSAGTEYACPVELTISTADELKEGLLACVSSPVVVDFGAVQVVDSAGLQVLVAATKTWERRNMAWGRRGHARALQEAITSSGLSEWWQRWAEVEQ